MNDTETTFDALLDAWGQLDTPEIAPSPADLLALESAAVGAGNVGLRVLGAPGSEPARWVLRACVVVALGLSERPVHELLGALVGWSPARARVEIARHCQELHARGLVEGLDNRPELAASLLTVIVGGVPGGRSPLVAPTALPADLAVLLTDLPAEPDRVVAFGGSADQARALVAARARAQGRLAVAVDTSPGDPAAHAWVWWAWSWGVDLLFHASESPFEDPWFGIERLAALPAGALGGPGARVAVVGPRAALQGVPAAVHPVPLPKAPAGAGRWGGSPDEVEGGVVSWPTTTFGELLHDDEVLAALEQAVLSARRGERQVLLLHGPPGTGKSVSAQAIAGTLGRALIDPDVGEVRGPLYGSEERSIQEIFRAADRLGAVVRLDEADDWLSRRSDAGVNQITAAATTTLLRALESFSGVAVLTTNRLHALDPAVHRRVDRVIAVDLPSPLTRLGLWGRYLPESLHDAQTLAILAALPLAGGDIVATLRELGPADTAASLVRAARRRAEQRRLLGVC